MSDQLSKGPSYLKHRDARGHRHRPGSGTEEAKQEPYSESLLQGKRVGQKEAGDSPSPWSSTTASPKHHTQSHAGEVPETPVSTHTTLTPWGTYSIEIAHLLFPVPELSLPLSLVLNLIVCSSLSPFHLG